MKNKLLFLGLVFSLSISFYSQNIVVEGKQWHVLQAVDGPSVSYSTSIYKIEGDVIENSIEYKQVWISNNNATSWQTEGLFREENNLVFYKASYDNEERLYYNFNLEIGDTAFVYDDFGCETEIEVINIDYFEYLGTSRKRWQIGFVDSNDVMEYWVEGIGSLSGVLHPFYYCGADIDWELLCAFENGNEIYHSEMAPINCYINNLATDEFNIGNAINLFPNPVKKGDSFIIETDANIKVVTIYNIQGQFLEVLYANTCNTSSLNKGIYFIEVKFDNGEYQTFKLIVN